MLARIAAWFFSDNGGAPRFTNNAPFRAGKDTIYEGGIRAPCVPRWPGVLAPGSRNEQPVSVQDLPPTLAAAAGLARAPASCDGIDQWDAIRSGQPADRPPVLIASHDCALIDGNWKLVAWENGRFSLYDLTKDPGEVGDLSASQTAVLARLKETLATLRRDLPSPPGKPRFPGGRGN